MANTSSYPVSIFPTLAGTITRKTLASFIALLFTVTCIAQDDAQTQPQPPSTSNSPTSAAARATPAASPVLLPAGTRIALVLTHDIQSRAMRRGDAIYAQITSPVNSGNRVVIPPGTFMQGTVDKLQQSHGRAELHLQSMSLSLPNGYVASVAGPVTLESDEGYALKDPGSRRMIGFVVMPAAGAGLGALIGHSVASSQNSTITSSLPPGCTGPPPYCLSSSLSVPPNKGESTVIGAAVGGAVGLVASLVLLASSHNFFLDVGTPVEMVLQQPLSLPEPQVADAVEDSERQPVSIQPMASRPAARPTPNISPTSDHGTCYTPGTPGTPDTVVPGAPGPDGVPGPPTIIPGIPASPGTPYPCP
jgi:hypothetical protein